MAANLRIVTGYLYRKQSKGFGFLAEMTNDDEASKATG
jgi:hypothetical protein